MILKYFTIVDFIMVTLKDFIMQITLKNLSIYIWINFI